MRRVLFGLHPRLKESDSSEVGQHEDVEQFGAGSGSELVKALP
jgi:hypothetical protein